MKTPLQVLSKLAKIPEHLTLPLKIFGCFVYVHIPKHERTKYSACAVKCVFLGYGINQKGYQCYDSSSRKIIKTMNCNFLECEYFYHTQLRGQEESRNSLRDVSIGGPQSWSVPQPSNSEAEPTEQASATAEQVTSTVDPPQSTTSQSNPPPVISKVNPELDPESTIITSDNSCVDEITAVDGDTGRFILPPRSTRGIPPKKYSPKKIGAKSRYSVVNLAKATEMARAFTTALYEEEEIPQTTEEAMKIAHWRKAMMVEMNALMKSKTWEVCVKPEGVRAVGCRWVFTIKRRPDGSIERYKARLVAKGYTQTYGVDYGYFTFVGGNLVTWRSKKQKVVALSSAEAEFRGIKSGLTEILWLKRLMNELELVSPSPCKLFCDNKAAISISEKSSAA